MLNTVTLFIIVVPVVVMVLLLLSVLFAPVKPDAEKTSAYECGFSAITGQTRQAFSIAYYVVAMLFLVFDREILLIFPLAQTLFHVQLLGFWVAMLFFVVLTLGFVFELGSGALKFTDQRSSTLPGTSTPYQSLILIISSLTLYRIQVEIQRSDASFGWRIF